jgi:NitT/TauT family transport system ATP-binding protein
MADNILKPIIELKNVSQSYGPDKKIIKDLNYTIYDKPKQGQFVVILGQSGCGKSTILRYVSGLQKPSEGEVLLYGKPRTELDRVGMVFQKYSSLPWLSVLENVELGLKFKGVDPKTRKERAMQMIEMVELQDHATKFAQYPSLSGGQLQRVAIARNLVTNSKLLLMDEPFGALDVKTRLKMQDSVLNIWNKLSETDEETTIIFVTHDISEAVYLADDIIILGGKPANIVDRISVPFGTNRTRDLKDDIRFKDMVREIEEKMMKL